MSNSQIKWFLSLHLNETYDDNTGKLTGKLFLTTFEFNTLSTRR